MPAAQSPRLNGASPLPTQTEPNCTKPVPIVTRFSQCSATSSKAYARPRSLPSTLPAIEQHSSLQIQTCGGPTTGFFRNNLADASPMECVLLSPLSRSSSTLTLPPTPVVQPLTPSLQSSPLPSSPSAPHEGTTSARSSRPKGPCPPPALRTSLLPTRRASGPSAREGGRRRWRPALGTSWARRSCLGSSWKRRMSRCVPYHSSRFAFIVGADESGRRSSLQSWRT